jgi:hypothetical protein
MADRFAKRKERGSMKVRLPIAGLAVAAVAAAAVAAAAVAAAAAAGLYGGSRGESAAGPTSHAILADLTGFPNSSNTGVPGGTNLTSVPGQVSSGPGWHFDPRGWVEVDGDGAVLSGLYIPYSINVTASDVTIQDDQIVVGGGSTIGIGLRHTSNVMIEDTTISGLNSSRGRVMAGIKDIYGDSDGLTILRDDISRAETGVQIEAGLVQDCYIHNSGFIDGDHVNGITSNGGRHGLLTIQHNTILIDREQTDAVGLFEDFGVQADRVITGNLLGGGGYAIYGGQSPDGPPTSNIVITNNQISTKYYDAGGYYGYGTWFNVAGSGDVWSGNTWNGTSDVLTNP